MFNEDHKHSADKTLKQAIYISTTSVSKVGLYGSISHVLNTPTVCKVWCTEWPEMSSSFGAKSVRQLQANLEGLSPGEILELITLINATLSIQTTESSRTCRTHHRNCGENKDKKSQGDPNCVTLNITLRNTCATMGTMYLAKVTHNVVAVPQIWRAG
jgi:hypothetical protein